MKRGTNLRTGLAVIAALAGLSAGAAPAAGEDKGVLGRHVALCAQMHLGQRVDPPSVTCEHDGHVHTFPTFGAMVEHMLEGDG